VGDEQLGFEAGTLPRRLLPIRGCASPISRGARSIRRRLGTKVRELSKKLGPAGAGRRGNTSPLCIPAASALVADVRCPVAVDGCLIPLATRRLATDSRPDTVNGRIFAVLPRALVRPLLTRRQVAMRGPVSVGCRLIGVRGALVIIGAGLIDFRGCLVGIGGRLVGVGRGLVAVGQPLVEG